MGNTTSSSLLALLHAHHLDSTCVAGPHHSRHLNGERHKEARGAQDVDKEDEMIPIGASPHRNDDTGACLLLVP